MSFNKTQPFRFWCQKVLPLVYDDSLSYYELLCKVVAKLNESIDNTNGLIEAFEELKTYIENYFKNLDVQEEINNKLDEMVKDGTFDKLLNGYFLITNNSVSECILGTFYVETDYTPSCCFMNGDLIYTFSCPTINYATQNKTNKGVMKVFNLKENTEIKGLEKQIDVGHANSCCFDGTNVYIVPVWDFTDGTQASAMYVYKYDASLNESEKIITPVNMMGCTFDNNALYFYGYDKNIYTLNDGIFTVFSKVNVPETGYSGEYNQDFCMKDGVVYISTPEGLLTTFNNTSGEYDAKKCWYIDYTDIEHTHYMGESEGMEFNSNGHLIHIRYTIVRNRTIGFVCELPNNVPMYNPINTWYTSTNDTMYISQNSLNQFKNQPYNLMCISELECKLSKPKRLLINVNYTENNTVIKDNLIINTASDVTFNCDSLYIFGCVVTVGTANINFTTPNMFYPQRSAILSLGYNSNITNSSDSNELTLCHISDNNTLTMLSAPLTAIKDKTIKIGSETINKFGLYKGSTYQGLYNEHGSKSIGESLSANSYRTIHIDFETSFPVTPSVSANLWTQSVNPVFGGVSLGISNITASGFDVTLYNNTSASFLPLIYYTAICDANVSFK